MVWTVHLFTLIICCWLLYQHAYYNFSNIYMNYKTDRKRVGVGGLSTGIATKQQEGTIIKVTLPVGFTPLQQHRSYN